MSDHEAPQPPADDDAPGQETLSPPPPPPPPPSAPRPLLRRDDHKHLAGVAGGLADYFGVEASAVRVGFFILAFFGIGIPVYIVGWLAMPSPTMPQSYIERWFGRAPTPAALLAITAGVILLMTMVDGPRHDGGPGWGVGWGLALLFGGWLLFRADTRAQAAGGSPAVTGAPAPEASTWHGAGGSTPSGPAQPWTPPAPRPRSILGRLTVGVTLALVGVAALLETLGVVSLEPEQYAGLALTIVGFGLIVGAWAGRAYGLIGLGFVLLPLLFVLSIGQMPVRGGAGDVYYKPATVEALRDSYTLGAGELELDLSDLDLDGASQTVRVSVGLGQTTVIVPDDVTVAANIELRVGEVELFTQRYAGGPFLEPINRTFEGASASAGRLELDIDNGMGQLTVRRDSEES
ncbi:MAG: PspC domain-containing protein [Nitriliruptorales bacterium]|nr:PspC domain-containing protein [Nitriliruptorales bacterium]